MSEDQILKGALDNKVICSRCKSSEATMIHARRYRKRTDDYYEVRYCRACQRARNNLWNQSKQSTPKKVTAYLNSNDNLIRKYANV